MIIQCRQCRTKFYFDDALMQGDGLWMRCSRCQHVFFQNNQAQASGKEQGSFANSKTVLSNDSLSVEQKADLSVNVPPPSGRDEDVVRFLDNVMEAKKELEEKDVDSVEISRRDIHGEDKIEKNEETEEALSFEKPESIDAVKVKKQKTKKSGGGWKIFIWSVLIIFIIPAVLYYVFYPQIGAILREMAPPAISEFANKYLGDPQPARPQLVLSQVTVENPGQRIINNNILGTIRVLDGVAVNNADYPISRVLVKGTIIGEDSKILGEQTSYAGNVLTDEELANLSEEEIKKILSRPEGNNNTNDKIVPNGRIPFMVVFINEPPGVIKIQPEIIGAERLL
jgi:predicted Zn finger-like uncharacterized protein